jgi:hypothetical protein
VTWVRLDDGFADHPKLVGIGPTALAVHVWALCYCSRHLTDGFVDLSATKGIPWVSKRSAREGAIERLIGAGLWSREDGGYLIHDFLEYNPDAANVREKRRLKAERQARWRERKKRGKRTPVDAPVDASTNTGVDASPHPAPKGAGGKSTAAPLGGAPRIIDDCIGCAERTAIDSLTLLCAACSAKAVAA